MILKRLQGLIADVIDCQIADPWIKQSNMPRYVIDAGQPLFARLTLGAEGGVANADHMIARSSSREAARQVRENCLN